MSTAQNSDPFYFVQQWWGNKPVRSDTGQLGINVSTKNGAFECFILAVLYSIDDEGTLAEDTFKALSGAGLTGVNLLASTVKGSQGWGKIIQIFQQHYHGRQRNKKTTYITEAAKLILQDSKLGGDFGMIYSVCGGNGVKILQRLREFKGISRKAFWIMREMRMQGVWNVGGEYCCVPDEQVGSSLQRWSKIPEWKGKDTFSVHLNCSQIVWNYFGQFYDLPILNYARHFKCNSGKRNCSACAIMACKDRSSLQGTPTKYCASCRAMIVGIGRFCSECGASQP